MSDPNELSHENKENTGVPENARENSGGAQASAPEDAQQYSQFSSFTGHADESASRHRQCFSYITFDPAASNALPAEKP